MKHFTVALLQLMSEGSEEKNLNKGLEYCQRAKAMGADLAVFPEMWNVGYSIPENVEQLKTSAITADSDFVQAFSREAKALDMAVGLTFLEQWEPLPRNTICIFDRFGKKVLTYAKVHTCDFGDECRLTYPYGQPDCNGHSSAFDGIAYRPEESGSRDMLIVEAGEREGIYLADFPVDELRLYRKREVHGNAYRHPKKYMMLVAEDRKDPFLREDYRA